jgi:uncharacterized membrane-anchored protein
MLNEVSSLYDLTVSLAFIAGAAIGIFAGIFVVLRVLRTVMHAPGETRRQRRQDKLDDDEST